MYDPQFTFGSNSQKFRWVAARLAICLRKNFCSFIPFGDVVVELPILAHSRDFQLLVGSKREDLLSFMLILATCVTNFSYGKKCAASNFIWSKSLCGSYKMPVFVFLANMVSPCFAVVYKEESVWTVF